MNAWLKNTVCAVVIGASSLGIYIGAYAPYAHARQYIQAVAYAKQARETPKLKKAFDAVLKRKTFVSEDAFVKHLGEDILITVEKSGNEAVNRDLVAYVSNYVDESDAIQVLNIAYMYNTLWERHRTKEYFDLAERWYEKALAIGPTLPMPLLNLFTMYRAEGNVERVREIGDRIKRLWPEAGKEIEETVQSLSIP